MVFQRAFGPPKGSGDGGSLCHHCAPHPGAFGGTERLSFVQEANMDFIIVAPGSRDLWPVVKMADGTYRMGPRAEIVGRWR